MAHKCGSSRVRFRVRVGVDEGRGRVGACDTVRDLNTKQFGDTGGVKVGVGVQGE